MDHGRGGMIGGERIQLGMQVHGRGFDPDPRARRLPDIDIRMDLGDRNSQRGPPIYDRVLAEQYGLAWSGGSCHNK